MGVTVRASTWLDLCVMVYMLLMLHCYCRLLPGPRLALADARTCDADGGGRVVAVGLAEAVAVMKAEAQTTVVEM